MICSALCIFVSREAKGDMSEVCRAFFYLLSFDYN